MLLANKYEHQLRKILTIPNILRISHILYYHILNINIFNKNRIRIQTIDLILICIGAIYLSIAISPVISFGDKELIEIPIPQMIAKIWGVFSLNPSASPIALEENPPRSQKFKIAPNT